jgi:7,8-dihydropterin-6-yl-methyl-4-(beta-D-ribofuranosyl)aminobenzene 5'-phosphate synthase
MNKFYIPLLSFLAIPLALLGYILLAYSRNRRRASRFYDSLGHPRDDGTRLALSPVRTLEVLPLVDWYAAQSNLETESGVSYLVRADDTTFLFDMGLNRKGEKDPPVLRNMVRLDVDPAEIDFVVLSHPHGDHIGGFKNQFAHQAIVRQENDPFAGKLVYATVPLTLTGSQSTVIQAPCVLAPGVATLGPLPRALFLMGYTLEQALAINVQGKGLVLLVGCGHPGIEALIERAEQLFTLPVYGVIGGLHFPVTDDRAHIGPIRFQQLLGSPNPPWRPIGKDAVYRTLAYLKQKGIHFVALSAHDTCDWSLHAFEEAFGDEYHPLKVGEQLTIKEKSYAQQINP